MNKAYLLFGILLFGSFAFAVDGAQITGTYDLARWQGTTAAQATNAVAGNVTQVNITTGQQLTTRWASFHGEVSDSTIILASNESGTPEQVYAWTYSAANTGEVCVSTAGAYDFTVAQAALGSDVDTVWGFPGAAQDRADVTFGGSAAINLEGNAINTEFLNTTGSSFLTFVVDNGSVAAQSDFAFCTQIESDATIASGTADYELMVPVDTGATTSYSFYMELE